MIMVRAATLRHVTGGVAAVGSLGCATAWLTASLVRPGHDAWRSDLSALAALDAPRPWITITGELLLAGGWLALATGLIVTFSGRDTTVAAGLLSVAGLGTVIQALAREDCDTALPACLAQQNAGLVSWHHNLHGFSAALAILASVTAPIALIRPFRGHPRWRGLATYSAASAGGGFVLLIGYALAPDAWTGLAQRVFLAAPLMWTAVVGVRPAAFRRGPVSVHSPRSVPSASEGAGPARGCRHDHRADLTRTLPFVPAPNVEDSHDVRRR